MGDELPLNKVSP